MAKNPHPAARARLCYSLYLLSSSYQVVSLDWSEAYSSLAQA
jgi:hypothetical protein